MNKEEEKKKIESDPDYIYCPSSNNSLERFLSKHPDGVNDEKAAQVLLTTPDKLRDYYNKAVKLIRKDLDLEEEENE